MCRSRPRMSGFESQVIVTRTHCLVSNANQLKIIRFGTNGVFDFLEKTGLHGGGGRVRSEIRILENSRTLA